ncbi:MAG TPA: hypothetical protein VKQ70_00230 [Caulobacteraceae bacterium]|jgi:hypothetical protein|nr:hypothetical protein [Caulobacteraceae bacterium]
MRPITGALVAIAALVAASASWAAGGVTLLHIASHLPKAAKASLDGGKAIVAPSYGSVVVAVAAGSHVLKVTTATGAIYQTTLALKPAALMTWKGKGYWCVNLLEHSLEVYSTEDCEEDLTDAG